MADVGAAIIERLEAHKPFWDAQDGRVDATVSLPDTPYPRSVVTVITNIRDDHYDGDDMRYVRVQLDTYSNVSAGEAAEINEAAIDALQPEASAGGFRFERAVEVDGPTDSGEQIETLYVYRARTDFALLFAKEG